MVLEGLSILDVDRSGTGKSNSEPGAKVIKERGAAAQRRAGICNDGWGDRRCIA